MITLKSSTADGSAFQVYDDDQLLGHIRKLKVFSGDRYQASIERNGQEEISGKEFEIPYDALRWIESRDEYFFDSPLPLIRIFHRVMISNWKEWK